jgi:hypothetical protein
MLQANFELQVNGHQCSQPRRAVLSLQALQDGDPMATRKMWAADSFQGLPDLVAQDAGIGSKGLFATTRDAFNNQINTAVATLNLTHMDQRLQVLEGWCAILQSSSGLKVVNQLPFASLLGELQV